MPVKGQRPLLNSLKREEFAGWLTRLADEGDIAGVIGGGTRMPDPVERFLSEEKGLEGHVGRFDFFRNNRQTPGNVFRLPGWAVEMLQIMDTEPFDEEDVEEDGVTRIISAERLLEILEGVP